MNSSALFLVGALALSASPYSCRKPTTQDFYDGAKSCRAVYDASLAIIPPTRFEQSGLDPSIVRQASAESMESAVKFGKQLGMSSTEIFDEAQRAEIDYSRAHSGAGKYNALRDDLNECLADNFGSSGD